MMDAVAEQRIREAALRGEFDDLPGVGEPLDLGDDLLVPEELRMAYRILKNAGFVPPEVQTLKDIGELERLIESMEAGEPRAIAVRKLHLMRMRLDGARAGNLQLEAEYHDRLVQRLT